MPAPFRRFAKRAAIADRANDVFSPSVRATREHIWFLLVLLANIVIWDFEFRKAEVFSASVQILFYFEPDSFDINRLTDVKSSRFKTRIYKVSFDYR